MHSKSLELSESLLKLIKSECVGIALLSAGVEE